jgi:hypothetical protein
MAVDEGGRGTVETGAGDEEEVEEEGAGAGVGKEVKMRRRWGGTVGWLAKGSVGTGGTSEGVRSRWERATDRREADDFARGIVGNGATRRCGYCSSRIDRADADEVDGVGLLGRGGV